jgi:L-asparaginase/Glu-tRNA(Gln) amidotransferase subunit D
MASHHHPRVLLLFLGGTALDERGRRDSAVTKASDVEPWMNNVGEMGIIAATDGVFVNSGVGAMSPEDWVTAAKLITDRYNQYEGFVVIHQAATLPSAATAFTLMLSQLGKPIVLVSSPLLSTAERSAGWSVVASEATRLEAKANFLNALQVAISDVGEVVVVIGHRLYRGRNFLGPLSDPHGDIIGKIDFGVRFVGQVRKRQAGSPRVLARFADRVAIVEFLPGLDPAYIAKMAAGSQGIFLAVSGDLTVPAELLKMLATKLKPLPIALNGRTAGSVPATVIVAPGDRQRVLVRWQWALGQSHQPNKLRQLMKS